MAKRRLPKKIMDAIRRLGAEGGRARARKLSKQELSEQGHRAGLARWAGVPAEERQRAMARVRAGKKKK